ncbi:MAG: SWIM zinc finger family protein [Anaerolineales bacterium]
MAIPKLTDAQIKTWLGATYAQRGKSYFNGGHVTHMRWQGETLTGRVQGSERSPYRVTVMFDGRHLDSDCSCPIGGHCKHVAALLYAAMSNPARRKKGPTLEDRLKKLAHADLLALATAMLEEAPELEDFVETQLMATGTATLEADALDERVRRIVAQLNDYDADSSLALRSVATLLQRAKAFNAERQWEAALNILHPLLTEVMLLEPTTFEDDRVFDAAYSAAEQASQCWRTLPTESEARATALRLVFDVMAWDLYAGGRDAFTLARDALLKHATPGERDDLREWAALAQRRPKAPAARSYADDEEDEADDYAGDLDDFTGTWAMKEWKAFAQKLTNAKTRSKRKATR